MGPLTYETIRPLIAREERQNGTLTVVFRCPMSGFIVEGHAPLVAGSPETMPHTPDDGEKRGGFLSGARNALIGMIRRPTATPTETNEDSEEVRERAILDAFRPVRHHFRWNEDENRWEANDLEAEIPPLSAPFVAQMRDAPVVEDDDRNLLVRLLAEIAYADQQFDQDEQAFLGEFLGLSEETGEQCIGKRTLTPEDLNRLSAGPVRETALMLALGLALTDEDLADSERDRLAQTAYYLGISPARAEELKRHAQFFLLEAGLEDSADPEAAVALGKRLGLPADDVRKAIARFQFRA